MTGIEGRRLRLDLMMEFGGGGTHCCDDMSGHLAGERVAVAYSDTFREYGIYYQSEPGETDLSIQVIKFCPWCGTELPGDLRDQWFDRAEKLGVEIDDDDLPEEMTSGAWWRRIGL